jgi:hypothetical protein
MIGFYVDCVKYKGNQCKDSVVVAGYDAILGGDKAFTEFILTPLLDIGDAVSGQSAIKGLLRQLLFVHK